MISIRPGTVRDAAAIAHVHVESWRTTYTGLVPDAYLAGLDESLRAKLWSEWLNGETTVMVAEGSEGIVGFAHAGRIRESVKMCDAELYSIYLLSAAQRKGIGSELLKSVGASLLRQEFKSMAVWVLERNSSRRFYERAGAKLAISKVIEIGGAKSMEVAYYWPELESLVHSLGARPSR
jgi:L-amino acid N-acyltransferase YncA